MQMIPNIVDAVIYDSKATENADLLSGFVARTSNQAIVLLAKANEKISHL